CAAADDLIGVRGRSVAYSDEGLAVGMKLAIVQHITQAAVVAAFLVLIVGLEQGDEVNIAFYADVTVEVERAVEGHPLKVSAGILIFVRNRVGSTNLGDAAPGCRRCCLSVQRGRHHNDEGKNERQQT